MKTIGLLGGMSWESTQSYYRQINRGINQRLGGVHSAELVMVSVDFAPIERLQREDDWEGATSILLDAAHRIEAVGAEALLICTNTMHKVAPEIQQQISIPLIHIADATAQAIQAAGIDKVGLLGTSFTMEQDFFRGRLCDRFGIEVVIPEADDRDLVHRVIYDELCLGKIDSDSRERYLWIIDQLAEQGAQGVILGCTEIGLLVQQQHASIPLFDTTRIHVDAALAFMTA